MAQGNAASATDRKFRYTRLLHRSRCQVHLTSEKPPDSQKRGRNGYAEDGWCDSKTCQVIEIAKTLQ